MSSKEVFALRKAGRIDEAVVMGRNNYAANPADPWNVKAFVWALHSAIKQAPDGGQKDALAREFLELPMIEGDEYLHNARAGIQRIAAPYAAKLQHARETSRAGNWEQALGLLQAIADSHPGQQDVEVAIAWELCKGIQHGLKEDRPDGPRIWRFVEDYGRLTKVPKPSDVHSRMLQWGSALARKGLAPRFCEFLKWWNPDQNLREEDYQGRQKEDGGHYDSTVENVIAGVAKSIGQCVNAEARQMAVGFVVRHIGRYPDQEWFPYYHATCLLAVGRTDEAKALMMPVVRAKMTEFWAWEKLGHCFPDDSDERLQCLCRAVNCPVKGPEFLLGVYVDLGFLFMARGHQGEGRYLLEKAKSVRFQHNWKIPAELATALASSDGVPAVDAEILLKELAVQADEVLLADLPWHRGVVSALNKEFKREDGTAKQFHFIAVELDGQTRCLDCRVPANKAFRVLEKMFIGAPIWVRVDRSGERPRVLSIKPREDGSPWDVYPEMIGIVERVNTEKGVAVVLLDNGREALAYKSDIPEANNWATGDFVACRSSEHNGKVRVLVARSVSEAKTSPYWKGFSGEYKPRTNGPGGHVNGVFIHERLRSGQEYIHLVSGIAVQRRGDDGRGWWEAICLKG